MITTNTRNYLVEALAGAPLILDSVWDGVSPDWYDIIVEQDRFTLRQALAHIADWEDVFLTRLKLLVTEDNPVLLGIDEGQLAIDHNYDEIDPEISINRYRSSRRRIVDLVRTFSDDDWTRPGVHSHFGNSSVLDIITLITAHDNYHFRQIIDWKSKLVISVPAKPGISSAVTAAKRTELIRKDVPGDGNKEAILFLLELPPGGEAPIHKHPGIGVGNGSRVVSSSPSLSPALKSLSSYCGFFEHGWQDD